MDRIGYPHVRVGSDMGFGSDTPKSISNPYPFKKIGFYPYPYPLSSQRIFLLLDRIGSGRKSTDTDTFAISRQELDNNSWHLIFFIFIFILHHSNDPIWIIDDPRLIVFYWLLFVIIFVIHFDILRLHL